jgi:hypothetical protein
MKRNLLVFITTMSMAFVGCIKNDPVLYTDNRAEIDQNVWNANAAGQTYPNLVRVPAMNRAVASSDSTLRRTAGTIRVRINLTGPPFNTDQTVGYTTFNAPSTLTTAAFPATASGQTPAAPAGTLAVMNAVAGTHYAALSGKVTIPKDSSFGYINIQILNPGPTAGQARFLGIRLDSTGTVLPSVNYRTLGLLIDQR